MGDFVSSTAFAVVLSISFGPIALMIIRQTIARGFVSALPGALGAAVADTIFAAVAFSGLQTIKMFWIAHEQILSWIGVAYLFFLGAIIFGKRISLTRLNKSAGFIPVFLLTLTNPLTIVTISSYALAKGALFEGIEFYLSLAGFLVGSFAGQMVYVAGGSIIRTKLIDHSDFNMINRISGALLIGFAVWQGRSLLVT